MKVGKLLFLSELSPKFNDRDADAEIFPQL